MSKALKPTSDSRLQDFLGTLQSLKPTPRRKALSAVESTVESIEPRDRDRANVASIIIRFYNRNPPLDPCSREGLDYSPQHWQAGSSRLPSSRVTLPAYAGPCLRRPLSLSLPVLVAMPGA